MKSFIFFAGLLATASGSILDKRACNSDNCARAVTGTKAGESVSASRVNIDCPSFQKATAYAPATTVTTTSGSVSATVFPLTSSTTIIPSMLPAYAQSACSAGGDPPARFASACSCAGVTKTTTTITPAVTVVMPTSLNSCNDPFNVNTQNPGSGCSSGSDGSPCTCLGTTDGVNRCVNDAVCHPCNTSADCSSGSVCVTNVGCGEHQQACLPLGACSNNAAPNRVFKARKAGTVLGF